MGLFKQELILYPFSTIYYRSSLAHFNISLQSSTRGRQLTV